MPFADPDRKKAYYREYMRRRRKGLTGKSAGEPTGTLNPKEEVREFNPERLKINGQWRQVLVRDGRLFDADSGELIEAFTITFE